MRRSKPGRFLAVIVLLLIAVLPATALMARQPETEHSEHATPTPPPPNDEKQPDHHKILPSDPVPDDETQNRGAVTTCVGGMAGTYPCNGIDLMSRVSLATMSSGATAASNLWGYVDLDDNREYAVVGLNNGTAVVEITDPANPRVVGHVPGNNSQWREVKVYQFRNQATARWDAYAYITTEATGSGIQIINLSQLPTSISLAATWNGVSTSHTVFIGNVDWGTSVGNNPSFPPILYINGANKRGFRMLSLANPTSLQQLGAWDVNYAHDIYTHVFTDERAAQCEPGHNPCEVVFNFSGNTNGVQVIDVTDKTRPTMIGSLRYPNMAFTHSGWISGDTQKLFVMDELDEQQLGTNTLVRTVNIANLRSPTLSGGWTGPGKSIEHNGYTLGNKYYMSHYTRGMVVLNIANPNAPTEASFFDTYPTDNGNTFTSAWGVYPYLPSGNVIISDIQRGLFVVREQGLTPPTATPVTPPTNTPPPTATSTPVTPPTNTPLPTATSTPVTPPTNTPLPTATQHADDRRQRHCQRRI
jgi:choice-of-anchor B domain-containing protein